MAFPQAFSHCGQPTHQNVPKIHNFTEQAPEAAQEHQQLQSKLRALFNVATELV